MRFKQTVLGFLLLAAISVSAQDSPAGPTLERLKSDFDASTLVARVTINDIAPMTGNADSPGCIVHGKFMDAFKGKVRKRERVTFFVRAQDGCLQMSHHGVRFVFLLRKFNGQLNAWVLEEWANYPVTRETLGKLRNIKNDRGI